MTKTHRPLLSVLSLYKSYFQSSSSLSTVKNLINLALSGSQPLPTRSSTFSLTDVSFDLMAGDSLALLGRNGAGKSTLLKIIAGVLSPTFGSVSRPSRITAILELGIGMNPLYSGRKNAYRFCCFNGFSHSEAIAKVSLIESFTDIGSYFDQPIKTYSSGMFARLAFSCAVYVESDLLLLDEILSVGDLSFTQKCVQYLQDNYLSNPLRSVIYVGHNTDVAERICNQGLVLDCGSIIYHGSVSEAINQYHSTLAYKPRNKLSYSSSPINPNIPVDYLSSISSGYGTIEDQPCFNQDFTSVGPSYPARMSSVLISPSPLNPQLPTTFSLDFLIIVQSVKNCQISLGFSVESFEGIVISGSNTYLRGKIFDVYEDHPSSFKLSLKLSLNPAKYTVSIGLDIIDTSGVPLFSDVRRQILLFEVVDSQPQNAGFVPLNFDVVKLPSQA